MQNEREVSIWISIKADFVNILQLRKAKVICFFKKTLNS